MASESNEDDYETPRFSRGGITGGSALGKCTAVLKTNVPEATSEQFALLASEAGCSTAELLRDLVCLTVHRMTFGELSSELRRSVLAGVSSPEEQAAWLREKVRQRIERDRL